MAAELAAGQDNSPAMNPMNAMSRKVMAGKPDVGMIKLLGRVRDTLQQDKRAHEEVMKLRYNTHTHTHLIEIAGR